MSITLDGHFLMHKGKCVGTFQTDDPELRDAVELALKAVQA